MGGVSDNRRAVSIPAVSSGGRAPATLRGPLLQFRRMTAISRTCERSRGESCVKGELGRPRRSADHEGEITASPFHLKVAAILTFEPPSLSHSGSFLVDAVFFFLFRSAASLRGVNGRKSARLAASEFKSAEAFDGRRPWESRQPPPGVFPLI